MEIAVNEFIINSILKSIGEKKNKSIKELDSILKDEYRNIILIITNNLDIKELENNSFLAKNQFDKKIQISIKNIDFKKIVYDINSKTEFCSYGLFKDKDKGYQNINQLYNQIVNLTEIDTKKYIFSYIEDEDIRELNTSINKVARQVKNALIVLTSNKDNNLIIINRKEERGNYIIRKPLVRDFAELKKIIFPVQELKRVERRDIFSISRPYTLQQFMDLCKKNSESYTLIYEENNEILGFIEAKAENPARRDLKFEDSYVLVIEMIAVKKEFRRRKIGTILYNEIEKYAKKIRTKRIEARAYSFDIETTKFLESVNLIAQRTVYEKRTK